MYKNKNKTWNVKHGQTWKVGPHTLICSDFTSIIFNAKFDNTFTDPPWNQVILNKFWKYANLENPPSIDILLSRIITKLKTDVKNSICVEIGKPKSSVVLSLLPNSISINQKYSGGSYSTVCYKFLPPIIPETSWAGDIIIPMFPKNSTFLEPCAGEGFFVEIAIRNNLVCTACEIIPEKFASMLSKLSKFHDPILVSE